MTQSEKALMAGITEHIILEKKGILKGNHLLPKEKSEKSEKVEKEKKKNSEGSSLWFYFIGLSIIGAELWYLYDYLTVNYPSLIKWIKIY